MTDPVSKLVQEVREERMRREVMKETQNLQNGRETKEEMELIATEKKPEAKKIKRKQKWGPAVKITHVTPF